MKHRYIGTLLLLCLVIGFSSINVMALTPLTGTDNSWDQEHSSAETKKKAARTTFTRTRRSKNPSYSAEKKSEGPTIKKKAIPSSITTPTDEWIPEVGKLYLQEKVSAKDLNTLFTLLGDHLGIQVNGSLDLIKTREAQAALNKYSEDPDKAFSNIYFDDKQNLTGYNYIYFEMCTLNKDKQAARFKKYFENGFYPNRSLFTKEEYYYKILYYYLYIAQDGLVNRISNAVSQLNKAPDVPPSFNATDILTFDSTVKVCAELDELRIKGNKGLDSPYEKIFTQAERDWLNDSIAYFTDIETHIALFSYPWFRANVPLSISAQVISHEIRETWIDQTISHRALLPLMLFTSQGDLQLSVEKLFSDTLNKLKLDNREVDVVVMSALKTWLGKQVEQGIKVEDRMKYKDILDELNVCPSGWIFYNLYSCKKPLEELKEYARTWDTYDSAKKNDIFNKKIVYLYAEALDKINIVFSDLEKLFGKVQVFGREQKTTSINHIFHRYRGEIGYYYEYLQFGLYDKDLSSIRFPLANSRKNCLFDFKAAFVKADNKKINHKNLLYAYDLLFKELASQGKISEIMKFEEELETFIHNENHQLGSLVEHTVDDRYDIYRIIANTYLSNKQLQTRALKVAEKSYSLARNYYLTAAQSAGYIHGDIPGALNNNCTEIDDFERQYEFYQEIALKLGKKIWLLLPNEDIQLYNRLQNLRNPEGFLL
ncbi:MAG: hypothetical protein KKD44_16130 [Proteobacteria bacterium]|nr:hypothetical protein [Pseudomonadota bacterium]